MAARTEQKDKKKNNAAEQVRQTLTKEMMVELEETFSMLVDANGKMPYQKLPLALKALGMKMNESNEAGGSQQQQDDVSLDKFMQIVVDCMKHPNWAANEMNESYGLFDKAGNRYIDAMDLRRVFNKLGEKLSETELHAQLREFDIDGDLQVLCSIPSP
jgi:Ca2+-binding EF-hand superfamily protein